jgi:phospholipase C
MKRKMKTHAIVTASILACAAVAAFGVSLRAATPPHPVSRDTFLRNLRAHVKHVFVIYQENHTFDNYFGTYPGADNLTTSQAQAQAHGYRQYDPIGKTWVTPFRITDPGTNGPSQARAVIEAKMDGGRMDRFVAVQEKKSEEDSASDARRVGLIAISHYDCDTIPYLWKYARAFALYDRFFQGMAAPSTPGNIEIIAAQEGESQAARFPAERNGGVPKKPGVPIYGDMEPAFGPDAKATRDTAGGGTAQQQHQRRVALVDLNSF